MDSINPNMKSDQLSGSAEIPYRKTWGEVKTAADTYSQQSRPAGRQFAADEIRKLILREKTVSSTPQRLWQMHLPEERRDHTGPTVVKNQMLFRDDKNLYAIDGEKGGLNWSIELNSSSTGALISEGKEGIIITDGLQNGSILAIDEKSGRRLWEKAMIKSPRNTVTGGEGTLLLGSWDSEIASCDVTTGEVMWKKKLPVAYSEAIGVTGDGKALFLGHVQRRNGENIKSDDGQNKFIIDAFDKKTGERKWRYTGNMMYINGCDLSPRGDVIIRTQNRMIAVDGLNGKEKWSLDTGAAVEDAPAFDYAGGVYFGNREGCFRAVDGESGKVRWSHDTKAPFTATPLVSAKGIVYAGDHNGALFAFNADDGAPVWGKQTRGKLGVQPLLTEDTVLYLGMADHSTQKGVIDVLYALEPDTGRVMKSFHDLNGPKICTSPDRPDVLFATHGNGEVLALSRNSVDLKGEAAGGTEAPSGDDKGSIIQFDDIVSIDGVRLETKGS